MKLLQELLKLHEDAAVAAKVRVLRQQLEAVNRQLDTKQQNGQTVSDSDPLKRKAAQIQAQIDQLNSGGQATGSVAESIDMKLNEIKNHMGETEYTSFATWKSNCKKVNSEVWFDGDKDICNAMVGPKPYQRGKTRAIGEWDGAVGSVHDDAHKVKKAEK